jgi:hypothetical protein
VKGKGELASEELGNAVMSMLFTFAFFLFTFLLEDSLAGDLLSGAGRLLPGANPWRPCDSGQFPRPAAMAAILLSSRATKRRSPHVGGNRQA